MTDDCTTEPDAVDKPGEPMVPRRPADLPDKFWDPAQGEIRLDALLKSYLELERKLGSGPRPAEAEAEPEATAPLEGLAFGAPQPEPAAEPWAITSPHPLIEADDDLNEVLRAAGFNGAQAQLVYDLAAQRLLPVLRDALDDIEAQQQLERLQRHFGGAETWSNTARQLKSWAASRLDPAVYDTLATSYEGVLALHQMMRASEPELLAGPSELAAELSEAALVEMVRDPRYWRQRDPEFIARVTAGFKRLYAD